MARVLRIYDVNGDFQIEIPEDARVTFGYFNPVSSPSKSGPNQYGGFSDATTTMKTTALRIYTKKRGETETQLACFMGVKGFRDSRIKLTRLKNRVVVEQNFEDDGEGTLSFGGKRTQELVAITEPGSYQ